MRKALLAVAVLVVASAAPLRGQVAWDSPLLVGPETPAGWGVYLVDPASDAGIGFLTTWRAGGGGGTGYRIGLAEDGAEELSVFGGVDFIGRMVDADNDFPLHVSWVAGAGFGVGDDFVLSFPLGISVGRGFQADSVLLSPYITPRLVLDAFFGRGDGPGEGSGNDDIELGLAVDFGIDINFDPEWAVRFAVSGGERDAIAIGLSFRVL